MRKNLFFIGIIFLGISLIISSVILANAIKEDNLMTGVLNGTLSTYSSNDYESDSDILISAEAGILLGYDRDAFIQIIETNELEGLPYTKVGDEYIFSKKALEEWLYYSVTN